MTENKQIRVGDHSFFLKEKEPFIVTSYSMFLAENFPHVGKLSRKSCVLDFGCGCGIQTILAALYGAEHVYGVDIHQAAIELTQANLAKNHIDNCTLLNCSENGWETSIDREIDLIISNPASLPSPNKLSATFWAGDKGDQMICDLIRFAKKYLSATGSLVFLHTSLVSLAATLGFLSTNGFKAAVVACQKLPFRDFYEPLLPYWHTLSQNGEAFFLEESNNQRYEFLYILHVQHNSNTVNPLPKKIIL